MGWYCEKCKKIHQYNELCNHIKKQLKDNPEVLTDITNFTAVAGQYSLITSQALDNTAKIINKLVGSNLSIEGTHQIARDIQVFRQLNVDAYCKSGVFSTAENARNYMMNATDGQLRTLTNKLNGTAQEVDWLISKKGELSSLVKKSKLLGEEMSNAPGIDGETVFRFGNKKIIERTSVKAAQGSSGLYTNAKDIVEALEKGTLKPGDTVVGIDGTKEAVNKALSKAINKASESGNTELVNKLTEAQKSLKVNEINNTTTVRESTNRLKDKISTGKASINITAKEVAKKACQGAVIGAAVSLTVSSITSYFRYKNGEIDREEAFVEVGEETVKGAVVGGALAGVTLFLPAGVLGFVGGMAVGIYIGKTCSNVLDEVFGKGVYLEVLNASGYIMGTSQNIESMLKKLDNNIKSINKNLSYTKELNDKSKRNLDLFDKMIGEGDYE